MNEIELFHADVGELCSAEDARTLTDRIKLVLDGTWELVKAAYTSRAWAALGYSSWDDYCTREFGTSRLKLPREERGDVVGSLRDSGLSVRAIATVTGLGVGTVARELKPGVPNGTPEPQCEVQPPSAPLSEPERPVPAPSVRGMDGKSYQSSRPTPRVAPHASDVPAPIPFPPLRNDHDDDAVVDAEIVDEPLAAGGQSLVDALERHMPGTQADLDRSGIRSRWSKNIHAIADIRLMDPEHVASVLRDIDISAYRLTVRELGAWCERLDNILEPKGLRAIEGGRS